MPVEAKPLFRPDVLRPHLAAFTLPPRIEPLRPKLAAWAELLASGRADAHKETQLLPDFLTDFFYALLGYTGPAGSERYTISREQLVEVDGKFADAVFAILRVHPEGVPQRQSTRLSACAHPNCGRPTTDRAIVARLAPRPARHRQAKPEAAIPDGTETRTPSWPK